MGYVYSDLAKSALAGMRTEFMAGFKERSTIWPLFAQKIPSDMKIETYPWIVDTKGPARWKDERSPGAGVEMYLQVENYDYETSWRVFRDALRFERYGQLGAEARGRGHAFAKYTDKLLLQLVATAPSAATYHGDAATYVAANDHSEGKSGTNDNLGSTAFAPGSLTDARVAMMKFTDAAGEPMGLVGDTIMGPPELEEAMLTTVNSERLVGSMDNDINVHKGAYKVIVNPHMKDTNDWALLCTSEFIMPLIFQELQAATPVEVIDDQLKKRKFVDYGSDMSGRAAFSSWRLLYYSQVS